MAEAARLSSSASGVCFTHLRLTNVPFEKDGPLMLIRALLRPCADGVRVHVYDVVKAIDRTVELDAISNVHPSTSDLPDAA